MRLRPVFTEAAIARLRKMKRAGDTNEAIAMALGSTANSVGSTCSKLGIRRYRDGYLTIAVDRYVLIGLRKEAETHRLTLPDFLKKLLTTIVDDNLFNAVIDSD
jgi:hypothetical protein